MEAIIKLENVEEDEELITDDEEKNVITEKDKFTIEDLLKKEFAVDDIGKDEFADVDSKKRRTYENDFKLLVVDWAEKNGGNRAAAKQYNIDEKNIRSWRKQKDRLLVLPKGKVRVSGGGRKPLFNELEARLYHCIQERKKLNRPVSRKIIQAMATKMFNDMAADGRAESETFVASLGWLQKFFTRYNLSLGRKKNTDVTDVNLHELDFEATVHSNI